MYTPPPLRHARYTLLLTFLIAAIAAQRVVGPFVAQRYAEPSPVRLTELARQLARRMNRRQTKIVPSILERTQLALRQIHAGVVRLVSARVAHRAVTPFFFRLPPPAMA